MPENIILTGFMATGKTTAGRELARQLDRTFVDMDTLIVERQGKTVEQIFKDDGEEAFRRLESQLCLELSGKTRLVIATGGGTLLNPENLRLMEESGTVICLTADVEEILRRLKTGNEPVRPLLNTPDPQFEIERLLDHRMQAYQAMPWHVDTTGLVLEEVVGKVKSVCQVTRTLIKNPDGAYPIIIGNGLLEHCGDVLQQAGLERGVRAAVVTNPVVEPLYAATMHNSLAARGYSSSICLMPDGEELKSLHAISSFYDQFLSAGLQRRDAVVALGGGVTGDAAGFAAATYLRGVGFFQVPTTLLAMVDSSVGGKTGVDLPQGKNLVGAFKQPLAVLMDPNVLKTLPIPEMRSGLAEVIKHGLIADPGLFNLLEKNPGRWEIFWEEPGAAGLIARAVRVKKEIVEEDPYECGRRAVLNLGHTLGHALETVSAYRMRHGEGVSIGMAAAARISAKMGCCTPALVDRLESLLENWGLPVRFENLPLEEIYQAMRHDKKKQGKMQRWILPHDLGDVRIYDEIPDEVLINTLKEIGGE